ncbi:hypothetical protein TNCV_1443761 [Trichonephila clavipes]|nr:hypothetical protein TNCV_1443761 [Trichonephila clavipes]
METVLGGLLDEACLVYLDDIIIVGCSFKEHLKNIRRVLQKLKEACDESVWNLSTNILRRLIGDYKFAYISNQLQKVNGICKVDRVFK